MPNNQDTMYKGVFIDWDNTLGDFSTSATLAMREIFDSEHLDQYFTSCDEWINLYEPHNILLWEQYGVGRITKAELMQERFDYPFRAKGYNDKKHIAQHIESLFDERATALTQLMPNALELLQYLAERYPLTVITNGFPEVQYRKFRATNVLPYFKHIIISEEVGVSKPEQGIFEIALQRNNMVPNEVIMIGDHHSVDIVGAHNAGIDQIYVCADTDENNHLPATYHVHNLLEIKDIL